MTFQLYTHRDEIRDSYVSQKFIVVERGVSPLYDSMNSDSFCGQFSINNNVVISIKHKYVYE